MASIESLHENTDLEALESQEVLGKLEKDVGDLEKQNVQMRVLGKVLSTAEGTPMGEPNNLIEAAKKALAHENEE